MTRLFFSVWLALFCVQASDVLMAVAPDGCVEDTRGGESDPCPERCARCVCCARITPSVISPVVSVPPVPSRDIERPGADEWRSSAEPRRILHIPKAR